MLRKLLLLVGQLRTGLKETRRGASIEGRNGHRPRRERPLVMVGGDEAVRHFLSQLFLNDAAFLRNHPNDEGEHDAPADPVEDRADGQSWKSADQASKC